MDADPDDLIAHLDGVDRPLRAGSTGFVPAGVVHATIDDNDEPVQVRATYPATIHEPTDLLEAYRR